MTELTKNAKPIDVVTVFEELRARKQDVEVGGLQYLVSLSNATPSAANIRRYAEIVRDRSILRQLVLILPLAYLLSRFWGVNGVWWAYPLAEIGALIITLLFFRKLWNDKLKDL
jgi:hypothetical protein